MTNSTKDENLYEIAFSSDSIYKGVDLLRFKVSGYRLPFLFTPFPKFSIWET